MKRRLISSLLAGCLTISIAVGAFGSEAGSFSVSDEAGKAGARLLAESKDFATRPFQIENGNLLLTLGVAGAVGLTYTFDSEIRDGVQRNRSGGLDNAADAGAVIGDPFLHLGAAALLYGGGILADSPRWKDIGEMLGESLILADGATLILKEVTGRGRPTVTNRKGDFRPFGFKSDYDGFPSMHTASSFAFASVLARTSDSTPVAVASYCAAAFVGFSRMNQNKHWASDVLLAAAIGELAGRVAVSQHTRFRSYAVVPTALDGGGGLALTGRF
ncbi:MAG: phosphatase PAP2 family protein [Geobacter sp.]|nr:phosphatase PAP2 family protein [Geobacter sp.]